MFMIEISPFHEKDLDVVLEMMDVFYQSFHYPFNKQKTQENLTYFVENKSLGQGFTIKKENHIFGYFVLMSVFSFEQEGKMFFLDELFIKEEARGQKNGQKVINFIKEFARNKGVKKLYLEVENYNFTAQEFYKKTGWKNIERQLMYLDV